MPHVGAHRIDLALFVNGIPVATAELKNKFTGQVVDHAIEQYRTDRDPRNLTLSRRAVVHFAAERQLLLLLSPGRTDDERQPAVQPWGVALRTLPEVAPRYTR